MLEYMAQCKLPYHTTFISYFPPIFFNVRPLWKRNRHLHTLKKGLITEIIYFKREDSTVNRIQSFQTLNCILFTIT